MIIIPAIDIIEGKCVRLSKGDYDSKKIYSGDPLAIAKEFEANGLKRLHLVDLDGAREGRVKNWAVLESIAKNTSLLVDFSGGLSDLDSVKRAMDAGVSYLAIGSMAVQKETIVAQWILEFGAQKFIIGADVKNSLVVINGWKKITEMKWKTLIERYRLLGVEQFFCTDVNKDGLLEGPAADLYTEILQSFPGLQLIASGGVSSVDDLLSLKEIGCTGAIIGKAIYEGRISLKELQLFN